MLSTLTKTEAINVMLAAIGADPVNELDEQNDVDVANALKILDKVSRSTQMQGWNFNTDLLTINGDMDNDYSVPFDNTWIKWKSQDGRSLVKRNGKLFDIAANSYSFKDPVIMEVVRAVDFDDLPEALKEFVAVKAAYDFQAVFMGDTNISQDLQFNLKLAQQGLVEYDKNMGNFNMLQVQGVAAGMARR